MSQNYDFINNLCVKKKIKIVKTSNFVYLHVKRIKKTY